MKKNPHASALGKLGGKVRSTAKTEAARRNAKLPRKKKIGEPITAPVEE